MRSFLPAVAAVLWSCAGPDVPSNESAADAATTAPADVRIINDGVFVNHETCGEGEVTLLFVHGWAIDRTYWSNQVDAFCPEYRVVTIDLPGHGDSGANRDSWTVQAYASDVRAVIDQLGLNEVVLIGHSMGGDIILESAIDNDAVIALVGIDNFKDAGAEYTDAVRQQVSAFIDQLRAGYDTAAVAFTRRSLFQPDTDSAVVRRVLRNVLEIDPEISVTTLEELFAYSPQEADRLSGLDRPLYLINSSASPTDSAGLTSTGVTFEILDAGPTGHYPMVEAPERFNQLLRQILEEITQAQPRQSQGRRGINQDLGAGLRPTTSRSRPS